LEAIWKKYDKKDKKYLDNKVALKFLKDFAEVTPSFPSKHANKLVYKNSRTVYFLLGGWNQV